VAALPLWGASGLAGGKRQRAAAVQDPGGGGLLGGGDFDADVAVGFGDVGGELGVGAAGDEFVEVFEGGGGGVHVGWGQSGGVGEAAAGHALDFGVGEEGLEGLDFSVDALKKVDEALAFAGAVEVIEVVNEQ
jgi:hypothetical protein